MVEDIAFRQRYMTAFDSAKHRVKEAFSLPRIKYRLRKRFHVINWLPKYQLPWLLWDFLAGITVGMMVVPQALAYAQVAGLPPIYGLYSAYMGSIVYCIFGMSKDLSFGPVALMSILVQKATQNYPGEPGLAIAVSFWGGLFLTILGFFRLGILINLISIPVIGGFTSAAAITISCLQINNLLGYKVPSGSFFPNLIAIFKNIRKTRAADAGLGISSLIILMLLRHLGNKNSKWSSNTFFLKLWKQCVWFICTARFTIIIIVGTLISWLVNNSKPGTFILTGSLPQGLPKPQVPWGMMNLTNRNNQTVTMSSLDVVAELNVALVIIPLIGFLESIAMGKTFARKFQYKISATQELYAVGLLNAISSFFLSYPTVGSFSRSALNSQCGVKSPLGGLFTAVVVLLCLQFLTSVFYYIPKAGLSAMIIAAVIPLFEYEMVPKLWKYKKTDALAWLLTFLLCFYEIETGIIVGICAHLITIILPNVIVPKSVSVETDVTYKVDWHMLAYTGVDSLVEKLEKLLLKHPGKPQVLDMTSVTHVDYTAVRRLKQYECSLDLYQSKLTVLYADRQVGYLLGSIGLDAKLQATAVQGVDLQKAGKEPDDCNTELSKLNLEAPASVSSF